MFYYESFEDQATPKGTIDVSSITSVAAFSGDGAKHGFDVKHYINNARATSDSTASLFSSEQLNLQCEATTDESRDAWIAAINTAVARFRSIPDRASSSAGSHNGGAVHDDYDMPDDFAGVNGGDSADFC